MSETPDIVERLLAMTQGAGAISDRQFALNREAAAEITRLRAALMAERERCAKVADGFVETAQQGIDQLTAMGMADITGHHETFGRAARNIAIAIRAIPPADGEKT